MMTGGNSVKTLYPGGSVAIQTSLDPSILKSDKLTGAIIGKVGKLPPVWYTLNLKLFLLKRVIGSKDSSEVEPIKMSEILMLNVNSAATVGFVTELRKKEIICKLKIPVCAKIGSKVTISRRIGNRFRLIGYGIIQE
jgi:translation initiation factor 2 subunit 3